MNGFLDSFQMVVFILYVSLFAGRILYLRWHNRVRAIVVTIDSNKVRGVLTVCLITAITTWFVVMVTGIVNPEAQFLPPTLTFRLIDSVQTRLIGMILVSLGFIVFTAAWVTLGNSWRVGNLEENDSELITQGIYAISRNPIYLFFILYLTGIFLINGALIFLIFAVLVTLNLHYLTLKEETFLSRVHGLSFREYCAVTNRYITWPRRWPMSRLRSTVRYPAHSK